jgi:hypothetical protein
MKLELQICPELQDGRQTGTRALVEKSRLLDCPSSVRKLASGLKNGGRSGAQRNGKILVGLFRFSLES